MPEFLFVTKSETDPSSIREGRRDDWSCSAKVRPGDRALVYVTGGAGIVEEWAIESDPWKTEKYFRCKVRFVRPIDPPVTIRELRDVASDWAPVTQNLRGLHAVHMPSEVYRRILGLRGGGLVPEATLDAELALAVVESMRLGPRRRERRLKSAPSEPHTVQTVRTEYRRNPDVIAHVLWRARGSCERCGASAPFNRRRTGEPYLEVHHTVRLADGGDDTVENAEALCPNCHRQAHYA